MREKYARIHITFDEVHPWITEVGDGIFIKEKIEPDTIISLPPAKARGACRHDTCHPAAPNKLLDEKHFYAALLFLPRLLPRGTCIP